MNHMYTMKFVVKYKIKKMSAVIQKSKNLKKYIYWHKIMKKNMFKNIISITFRKNDEYLSLKI